MDHSNMMYVWLCVAHKNSALLDEIQHICRSKQCFVLFHMRMKFQISGQKKNAMLGFLVDMMSWHVAVNQEKFAVRHILFNKHSQDRRH